MGELGSAGGGELGVDPADPGRECTEGQGPAKEWTWGAEMCVYHSEKSSPRKVCVIAVEQG